MKMTKKLILILSLLGLLLFSGCSGKGGDIEIDEAIPVNDTSLLKDSHTNSLINIEWEHSRIHDGYGFQYSSQLNNLATGSITYLLMNTTTNGIHWRDYSITCDSAPLLIELYENPTITNYGTLQNISNRNRFSSVISTVLIYANSTIVTDGTLLIVDGILGTKQDTGSTGSIALEWILKTDSIYTIKITNNNSNNVNCITRAFWYET